VIGHLNSGVTIPASEIYNKAGIPMITGSATSPELTARGLKGEQIPLGARMFSVADTLDAITSDRPYRPAQSLQAAREEIERWSGKQFDPQVVKVFLTMPENIWGDLRRQIGAERDRFAYSTSAKGSI
jgi:hypothetical protein